MQYDLNDIKEQLNRIETLQIDIATELNILDPETREYIPYEERHEEEETEELVEDGMYNHKTGQVEPKEQMRQNKTTIGGK